VFYSTRLQAEADLAHTARSAFRLTDEDVIGRTLAHYHVVRKLGAGGMGEVYLAHDTVLSRFVALKMLPPGANLPDQMHRLIDEATATSALNHPNIATIHELRQDSGVHFIVMEYVEGETLKAKVTRGALETSEIVTLATQIADALEAAHGIGIIHCDIKSSNIIMTPRGYAKVLDFGLATRTTLQTEHSDDITREASSGTVTGTVQYMSPEQALGKALDHRSDLFSLGVVLYEMATGTLPFSGTTAFETIDQTLHSEPASIASINPEIPAGLQRIIMRCLEKRPEDRVQAAVDLARDLRDVEASPHTARRTDTPRHNLPQRLTSFVGRQREIAAIHEGLTRTRLLTLTGPGGIGKTRLSLQVAARSLHGYPDGVVFVELASLADPGLVPQTVASTLGLREEVGRPITDTIVDYLKPRCLLLVMDNCEHLMSACARLIDMLVHNAPQVTVLATSRESLAIDGEHLFRVPSLTLPEPGLASDLESVGACEAVELFVHRAQAVKSTFGISRANAHLLATVCAQLDGIPLAIELAASRMKVLSLEQIAARLEDRLHLLTGGSRTALPRHQTLLAAIDWSYNLLTDAEKVFFRRLSVFAGGWTLDAAETVCTGNDLPQSAVLELLSGLVDKSLVLVEEREGQQRYRLIVTLREYAHKRLMQTEEGEALTRRHVDFFVAFALEADTRLVGNEQKAWLERLNAEYDNLRAVLNWTLQHNTEIGLELAGALGRFWHLGGHWNEGQRWLAQLLGREDAHAHGAQRVRALNAAARIADHQGHLASSRAFAEQALTLSRELGDKREAALALNCLAVFAGKHDDYAVTRSLLEESLAISQELGDTASAALTLNNIGIVALRQGEFTAARSHFHDSLAFAREAGDKHRTAIALLNGAYVAMRTGDHAAAQSLTEEGLRLANEIGDKAVIPDALNSLGDLAGRRGDEVTARALHRESLAAARERGDKRLIALTLLSLGVVAEDDTTARSLFEESLILWRELGERAEMATALNCLGSVRAQQSDYAAAESLHEEGLAICQGLGIRDGIAQSLNGLADVARLRAEHALALGLYRQSLTIWWKLGEKPELVRPFEQIAEVLMASGQPDLAVRLWGAAEGLRKVFACPRRSSETERYGRNVAVAREALGDERFAAAWTQGQAMTVDQAVEHVLHVAVA
jgi:predicted ATPase/serine/threonine protein kinase